MFYAHFILAKKGPLARIWLAAHWDKKLTKAHVFETNIETSVDGIMQPKVKMALRTSGHLLLGVVRIYSRKAKYLLADCNEAFVKIKMAFRPGMVDLPEEHREAAVNAITLPEVFHDFDTTMPELNDVDIEAQFSLNQSRAEEITMREDYGNVPLVATDDGFGDMGFDTDAPDLVRQTGDIDRNIEQNNLLFTDGGGLDGVGLDKDKEPVPSTSRVPHSGSMEIDSAGREDGFAGGLFEGGLFDDTPMPPSTEHTIQEPPLPRAQAGADSDDDIDDFGGPPSVGMPSSDGSRPPSVNGVPMARVPSPSPALPPSIPAEQQNLDEDQGADQTTLVQNEEETFALAPVDASALKGFTKTKRKRKLIVDEVKNISGEEMKNQLSDTSDIVTTLDLAPPTKRLMHWKETGGVEKLFALPARSISARTLFQNYQRHLVLKCCGTEDFAMLGDADSLALDQVRDGDDQPAIMEPPTPARRGRKRKVPLADGGRTPAHTETEATPIHPEEILSSMVGGPPSLQPTPSNGTPMMMPPPSSTPAPGTMYTPAQMSHGYHSTPVVPPQHTPLEEIPHLPPDQVQDLLGPVGTPHHQSHLPQMENMGYDQSQMANMGYEEHIPGHSPSGAMSERVHSPWQGDYDYPPSLGPGDEQQQDETDEQFEERVLNKRAFQIFNTVRAKIGDLEQITFSEMCHRNTRKQVAQKFYSLLVLKKFQALELEQSVPYGEIFISKGSKFHNPVL